jgi:hypothetical protein
MLPFGKMMAAKVKETVISRQDGIVIEVVDHITPIVNMKV